MGVGWPPPWPFGGGLIWPATPRPRYWWSWTLYCCDQISWIRESPDDDEASCICRRNLRSDCSWRWCLEPLACESLSGCCNWYTHPMSLETVVSRLYHCLSVSNKIKDGTFFTYWLTVFVSVWLWFYAQFKYQIVFKKYYSLYCSKSY